MASSGDPGDNRQPRVPKDMKGLLRLCVEAANPNQEEGNLHLGPMDPERKAWLEKALTSMSVSHAEEMNKAIATLQDESKDEDDKIAALESLLDWCDNMDFAIDFHKIGGFSVFPSCLMHSEPEIRWQCLELIGTLVQNNPYCQAAVLEHKLMAVILQMLDTDSDNTVRTKALYAVSCLTRDHQAGLDQFIEQDGFSHVMRAMQTDVEKLKIKSAFMLSSICTDNNKCKDILCDMGMIDQLAGQLSEKHAAFHEHVLSALLSIVRDHPRSLQECGRPELNLTSVLQQKMVDLKGNDVYQEEYEYARELLEHLKTLSNSEEPEATR